MNPSPPPFRFPLRSPIWPVRDADVGVAFPKGGMHGAFQAGVVHAFVLSGYLPVQVGGSSMGAYAATTLAIASEQDDQAARLRLVSELIALWRQNPGRYYYTTAWNDPKLKNMLEDGRRIGLSMETLGRLGWDLFQGSTGERVLAALLLWVGIFPNTRSGWRARAHITVGAARAAVDLLRKREGAVASRMGQGLLNAYGMRESILPINPGDVGFNKFFEKWMPAREGRRARVGDLHRTRLTLQMTNLRWARDAAEAPGAHRKSPVLVLRGKHPADLLHALHAAVSLQPMHAPLAARDVFPEALPPGVRPEDPLADSSHIASMPIDRLIERWREAPIAERARPKRIFAVFSDPLEGAPPDDSGFFAAGVHDIYQLSQRDQLHDIQITRLLTELIRAAPGADSSVLAVDPSPIGPDTALGFRQVSVPEDAQLDAALSHGCRAAMQVLHRQTLLRLAPAGSPLDCVTLRDKLRAESDAPEGYFVPVHGLCGLCTQVLVATVEKPCTSSPVLREADRLDRLMGARDKTEPPPLVVVPAGGAFLGVFHVGALVALREHGLRPDVYAGASVGTMFSTLLHAGLKEGRAMDPGLVERMLDVDKWVDQDDRSPEGPGRVDRVLGLFRKRLEKPELRPLLSLRIGELMALLQEAPGPKTPERTALREQVDQGLAALLFGAAVGPQGREQPALGAAPAGRQAETLLQALLAGDVPGMLGVADRIARHFGIYEQGHEHDGELIGFDETTRLLSAFAFAGGEAPTLAEHGGREAHFLFTVTNHSTGRMELFGGPPGEEGAQDPTDPASPDALQAVLAGSSLPLAFRRRSRAEVFGLPATEGDTRYTDGGIYNNFPVDSALKYLRYLSQYPEYRWLGGRDVRILLLPLDFPSPPIRLSDHELGGCVRGAELSWRQGEQHKLKRVLNQQKMVRLLASTANAALASGAEAALGPRLAIRSDFDVVAPAHKVYPSALSFKRWLGFTPDKQAELLGAGCRRARYSLLFREWRERLEAAVQPASLEDFDALFRTEVEHTRRHRDGKGCVLGAFNPRPCAFLGIDPVTGERVRAACFASAKDDLPAAELPPTSRADAWSRLVKPR